MHARMGTSVLQAGLCIAAVVILLRGTAGQSLAVSIAVDYTPPSDAVLGVNEYRAASTILLTCLVEGATGTAIYTWDSTLGEEDNNQREGMALLSSDTGNHTCMVTDGIGNTGSASAEIIVVGAGVYVIVGDRSVPTGALPNNSLIIADNATATLRLHFVCRSTSSSSGVGQLLGLDGGAVSTGSLFTILSVQVGTVDVQNNDGHPALTAVEQGVYTCRLPDESGEAVEVNVGIYPSGFNTLPTVAPPSHVPSSSHFILTCLSSGSPATIVTWARDGTQVSPDGSTIRQAQIITNRATATYENILTIYLQPGELVGSYSCRVDNSLGTSGFSEALIISGLQITGAEQPLMFGNSATLSCTSDLDVIATEWLDGMGTLLLSGTSAVLDLVVDPVTSDLQGQLFTCRVTSPYGTQQQTVSVTVSGVPENFREECYNQTVLCEHYSSANNTCSDLVESFGTSPPTYLLDLSTSAYSLHPDETTEVKIINYTSNCVPGESPPCVIASLDEGASYLCENVTIDAALNTVQFSNCLGTTFDPERTSLVLAVRACSDATLADVVVIIIIDPPTVISISSSPPSGVPTAGEEFLLRCSVTVFAELLSPVQIHWTDPTGTVVVTSDENDATVMDGVSSTTTALNFTSLLTSQAGLYTCEAALSLFSEDDVTLFELVELQVRIPPAGSIFLSHDQRSNPIYAGAPLTISCFIEIDINVDTPVIAEAQWLPNTVYSDSRIVITPATQFLTTALYLTTLTFESILLSDDANYSCSGYFRSDDEELLHVLDGNPRNNAIEILVESPRISVTVDPESIVVPNMAPYNEYTITCTAVLPSDVNLLWSLTWIDAISEQEFVPSASVNITTSTNVAVATSVLHVVEETAASFQPVCAAEVFTPDMEVVSTESSPGVNVTVTAPSVPLPPVPMIIATSFEVAVINWTVSAVAYTPETFHIEYAKEGSMEREITSAVVMGTFNFSAVNVVHSFTLGGLEANSTYHFQVIATNSVGATPSQDLVFTTRDSDAYSGTTTFHLPLGAPICILLEVLEVVNINTSAPAYSFLPLYHTPLQQPNITTTGPGLATVAVSYPHASPSLTGSYILCRVEPPGPALCGGQITINITIPTLTISTDLLVTLKPDNGEVTCTPSDPRAPVQWVNFMGFIPPDIPVLFSPSELSHTATFYGDFPPDRSEVFICDLINVEEPDVPVDPQNVTIRFISNPVTITNNGKELQPGAVISAFSNFFTSNQPILSLRCFSLSGHGQLQWRAREVESLPDLQVLSSETAEAVNISYSSNPERRDVGITHHPFGSQGIGYYVCRSEESGYEVEVYTTLDNPIWELVSPTQYTVPLGAVTTIMSHYADFSFGYQNNGLGFTFELRFIPLLESLPVVVLTSGVTDMFSTQFSYSFPAGFENEGVYQLSATHLISQTAYFDESNVTIFEPTVEQYDPELYVALGQNVTARCIPDDERAPVLWNFLSNSSILFHDYPVYFILSPLGLNHTATFNATAVEEFFDVFAEQYLLEFQCGFMDGNNNSQQLYNPTLFTVAIVNGSTFEFQQQAYTVSEDAGTVTLCVTFDGDVPGGQTATITVETENGNATESMDYSELTVNFVFDNSTAPVSCLVMVEIVIFEDLLIEGDEVFSLTMSSTDAFVRVPITSATVIIQDNDFPPPDITISSSPPIGVPVAGERYILGCEVTVFEELLSPTQIYWTDPSGAVLSNITEDIDIIMTYDAGSAIAELNFTSLRTSQAGVYLCVATVTSATLGRSFNLNESFLLQIRIPPPENVFLSHDQSFTSESVYAGAPLTISCLIEININVDTAIFATIDWLPSYIYNDSRITITSASQFFTTALYTASASFNPVLPSDISNFTCSGLFESSIEVLHVLDSGFSSNSIELAVEDPPITISINPGSQVVPSVSPYNTFNVTCTTSVATDISLEWSFTWLDASTDEQFSPSETVVILSSASGSSANSVLHITMEERAGFYQPMCIAKLLSPLAGESSVIATENSTSVNVTVTAPRLPLPPTASVAGTSFEIVVINWTVSIITFTPETYYIQYTEEDTPEMQISAAILGTENVASVDEVYSVIIDGLKANTTYSCRVIATNTVGGVASEDVVFTTRESDAYDATDVRTLQFPLGAPISILLEIAEDPLAQTPEYNFLPLYHTPLQQPNITTTGPGLATVAVSYPHASPSLTGPYILCRVEPLGPALCGGQITINVTIPTLTISTDLLVTLKPDNGEVTCTPSDPRTPVQWVNFMGFIPPDIPVLFSPSELSHAATFYGDFPPDRSEVFICDLINVEEPDVPVDPQNVTIRFISNPVAITNNGKELQPGAVISAFSVFFTSNQPILSLRCFSLSGHGQLQWRAREVESLPDLQVLSSETAEAVNISYSSNPERRDVVITHHPFGSQGTGYYVCRSEESGYEVEVYTTLDNPIWELVSPTQNTVPLGAVTTIMSHYADFSFGYQNNGLGFTFELRFIPLLESLPVMVLISGVTDVFSTQFSYSFPAGFESEGVYQLSATHVISQTAYFDESNVTIFEPTVEQYDPELYVALGRNVTARCIPDDERAPVLWNFLSNSSILFHDYPAYFILSPLRLNHTATFNATAVEEFFDVFSEQYLLEFQCGFMDGNNNSQQLYNPTLFTVAIVNSTTFEFQQQVYTVSEDAGTVTLCVMFDGEVPGGQTATITVATENGNATESMDYSELTVNFVFDNSTAPVSCLVMVEVVIFEDLLIEGDEVFSLTMSSTDAFVRVPITSATVIIQDNDFPPPEITISSSPPIGVPVAGEQYILGCKVTVFEELLSPIQIYWTDPSGAVLSNITEDIDIIMTYDAGSAIAELNFTSLRTSQAGIYLCVTTVTSATPERAFNLNKSFVLQIKIPPPENVFLSHDRSLTSVYAGVPLTISCLIEINVNVDTAIFATIDWLPSYIYNDSRITITNASQFFTTALYTASVSFNPVLHSDISNFTCFGSFESSIEVLHVLNSGFSSNSIELAVEDPPITISINPGSQVVPSVSPYNTFNVTCTTSVATDISLEWSFTWLDASTDEQFSPSETVVILSSASGSSANSVLHITMEERAGFYQPMCIAKLLSPLAGESSVIATKNSTSVNVTVTAPRLPLPPTASVAGTSFEIVVINWTVSIIAFTPETYYIQYTEEDTPEMQISAAVLGTENVASVDEVYSVIIDGLKANTTYSCRVIATNTVGGVASEDVVFTTRESDAYNATDVSTLQFPLGAPICIILQIAEDSLVPTPEYSFLPLYHIPLQQPNITTTGPGLATVAVSYPHASPSLTGPYILCRVEPLGPALCGGQITINVTIPTLTISTDLLVTLKPDNGEVTCTPSDPRAPVQWVNFMGFIPPDIPVLFSPSELSHTATFYGDFAPDRSEVFICDLINVEEPNVPVDPQNVTIRFISNPVAITNNGKELQPGAVISAFSTSFTSNQPILILRCFSLSGHGQLQWRAREVESLPDLQVLSSETAEAVNISYSSNPERRDVVITHHPFGSQGTGYYVCRSEESGYEVEVYTTLDNPIWELVSPTQYTVPLGAVTTIMSHYADFSFGYQNNGLGFTFELRFIPLLESLPVVVLTSGVTDMFSTQFSYSFPAGFESEGVYQLSATHVISQMVFVDETNVTVFEPTIVQYDPELYVALGQNVTARCIPDDIRAPVLWEYLSQNDVLFHNYSEFFLLSPPGLNHTATFNATAIALFFDGIMISEVHQLGFQCGFMNGSNGLELYRPTQFEVIVVPGATFGFQEAVYTVSEGAGTVVLCVTYDREIPDGQTATITVATEGGSATALMDFNPIENTLMFDNSTAQSNCTATVEITIFEDALVESTEAFFLTLHSSDAFVVFSTGISTVTIQDNDYTIVGFERNDYTASEDAGFLEVCIDVLTPSMGSITISTVDGTALAGLDYQGLVEAITITPAETQYCVNLQVSQDTLVEPSEYFTITISTTADYIRFTDAQNVTVIIEDTDVFIVGFERPVYTFDEDEGSVQVVIGIQEGSATLQAGLEPVVIVQSRDGTANAGDDYLNHLSELTFTIGVEAYLAAIIIIDDGISEGEESFTLYLNVSGRSVQLNPASATVFIADSSAFSEVPLSTSITAGLIAEFYCSSAPAVSALMLTWFVDGVPTDDTVILERGYYHQTSSLDSVLTSTLFAPGSIANNGSRIQCGVVGQDMVLELSDEAVFTVQGLGATFGFQQQLYLVNEDVVSLSLCIAFAGEIPDGQTATIVAATEDGSATVVDYQPLRDNFTFSDNTVPSNCTRTVEVVIFDDAEVEITDETFLVILSSNDVLVQFSNGTAVIHIQDNDYTMVGFERATYTLSEDAGFLDVCINVQAPSMGSVTISTAGGTALGGFDYQEFLEEVSLTQTQTQYCVTISVVDDSFIEPEESFAIILTTVFEHIRFTATQNATVQILDNDRAPPSSTLMLSTATISLSLAPTFASSLATISSSPSLGLPSLVTVTSSSTLSTSVSSLAPTSSFSSPSLASSSATTSSRTSPAFSLITSSATSSSVLSPSLPSFVLFSTSSAITSASLTPSLVSSSASASTSPTPSLVSSLVITSSFPFSNSVSSLDTASSFTSPSFASSATTSSSLPPSLVSITRSLASSVTTTGTSSSSLASSLAITSSFISPSLASSAVTSSSPFSSLASTSGGSSFVLLSSFTSFTISSSLRSSSVISPTPNLVSSLATSSSSPSPSLMLSLAISSPSPSPSRMSSLAISSPSPSPSLMSSLAITSSSLSPILTSSLAITSPSPLVSSLVSTSSFPSLSLASSATTSSSPSPSLISSSALASSPTPHLAFSATLMSSSPFSSLISSSAITRPFLSPSLASSATSSSTLSPSMVSSSSIITSPVSFISSAISISTPPSVFASSSAPNSSPVLSPSPLPTQQPRMSISSTSSGVPMAGEDYSLRCGVMILEDLLSTIQIYWINPSGTVVSNETPDIELVTVRNSSSTVVELSFSTLRTSQVGLYTCVAEVVTASGDTFMLNEEFRLQIEIPVAESVSLSLDEDVGPVYAGAPLTISCNFLVNKNVDTPIHAEIEWFPESVYSENRTRILTSQFPDMQVYSSSLTFDPLFPRDVANYTCSGFFYSNDPLNVLTSQSSNNSIEITPEAPPIMVSVTPETIVVPNFSPYNEFSINCTATLPSNVSLQIEFTWINALTRQEFTPSALVSITNINGRESGSVLHIVQERVGTYLIVCIAESFSDVPSSVPISTETSVPVNITATEPSIVQYDPEVYVQVGRNATVRCIPDDLRAPVIWTYLSQTIIFLQDYPQHFTLSPPGLRSVVMFNVTAVLQYFDASNEYQMTFQCGFMNNSNSRQLYNPLDLEVYIQSDRIRLQHKLSDEGPFGLQIFNNTVVNHFGSEPSNLMIECSAAQGDELPIWLTDNSIIANGSGVVTTGEGYGANMTDYTALLYFDNISSSVTGTYMCYSSSRRSGLFSQFYLTSDNPFVGRVSPAIITVDERDPARLEFQIAVDSNGNSWNNEELLFHFTSKLTQENNQVTFTTDSSDFPQNYGRNISTVSRNDAGIYTAVVNITDISCEVDEDCLVEASIELDVILFCDPNANGGILWPRTQQGVVARAPCSQGSSFFRAGPLATRYCTENGEWVAADLNGCTLVESSQPFFLLWLVIEADGVTEDDRNRLEIEVSDLLDSHELDYTNVALQSVYTITSLTFEITLNSSSFGDEEFISFQSFFSDDVFALGGFAVEEDNRGLLGVQSSESCPCVSSVNASAIYITLCEGGSISPCVCTDEQCQCQDPFVGDGLSCTLDSDGDGYPDSPLQSCTANNINTYCIKDVCSLVNNPSQDPLECQPDAALIQPEFNGCPYGPDPTWNITWANTEREATDVQRCPGGVDTLGMASRYCDERGNWSEPDVLECESYEFMRISEQAEDLLSIVNADTVDMAEVIALTASVTEQLMEATESESISLLPVDLNVTNSVMSGLIYALESSLEQQVDSSDLPDQNLIEVFDNVLEETNVEGWQELQSVGTGSQALLDNAERYGLYLASAINDSSTEMIFSRPNIVISARQVSMDTLSSFNDSIVFPLEEHLVNHTTGVIPAQITIPTELLTQSLNTSEGISNIPVYYILFQNLEEFLPLSTQRMNNTTASAIISSQLGSNRSVLESSLLLETPIQLSFAFESVQEAIDFRCVFWNFSEPVGNGSFVSTGVQRVGNTSDGNTTTVFCESTHLTSFAVLVDVRGALQDISAAERLALQVVSYIGCGISVVCLAISIVYFLLQGKKLFNAVHFFIHLNLAISLFLGYLTFLSGVEAASSSRVGCAVVAALLHYFFLAAFCWMLCEGIMLYLMLVVVFSRVSKKWWFFLLIGWGLPLPAVIAGLVARHDFYGVRIDGNLEFCWLSTEQGTIWAFVAPMLLIIVVNVVFLCLVLRSLWKNKKVRHASNAVTDRNTLKLVRSTLKATVILLPLLGMTWAFGILTLNANSTVFAWLFLILNSSQGLFIVIFHVIRSNKIWSKIGQRVSTLRHTTFKKRGRYDVQYLEQSTTSTLLRSTIKRTEESTLNIEAHHATDSERLRKQTETPFAETTFKGFSNPLTESISEDH